MTRGRLTSAANPVVKSVCALKHKRYRRESGLFLIEGAKLAAEALDCGIVIRCALAHERFLSEQSGLADRLRESGTALYEASESIVFRAADAVTPQGLVCAAELPEQALFNAKPGGRYLGLCGLSDPGNLGAILRSAEAFGTDGVLVGPGCADLYSPKTVRGSMGSLFRVPHYTIDDMQQMVYTLRKQDFTVYAAALGEPSVDVRKAYTAPGGYVTLIGNEGSGLPEPVIDACTAPLCIPMEGRVQSLNAAIAASILLFCQSRAGRLFFSSLDG